MLTLKLTGTAENDCGMEEIATVQNITGIAVPGGDVQISYRDEKGMLDFKTLSLDKGRFHSAFVMNEHGKTVSTLRATRPPMIDKVA
jgi:hypothetical protein